MERMKVLELLEAGKISADEATKLLEALGGSHFMSKDARENLEERVGNFAKEVNKFAKDIGCKVQDLYKEVEPKIKKASQSALEKTAAALDDLAHNINDSIEKSAKECCEDAECACGDDDNTPKPN